MAAFAGGGPMLTTTIRESLSQPEDAKLWAEFIAFSPVVFQLARSLKNLKILEVLAKETAGLTFNELLPQIGINEYSLSVVLDGGESCGLLSVKDGRYFITLAGRHILKDKMTTVNMNFVNDVCYEGLADLESALRENKPSGLKVFGNWATIYEGLTELPKNVLKSWLEFDHYYSDGVFPKVIPIVAKENPKTLLDVGCNTGKFAVAYAQVDTNASLRLLDHPKQLELAQKRAEDCGLLERISGFPMNLLDHSIAFPKSNDAIWMSQFLDCFSKEDILQLMSRARVALNEDGYFYILETFTDRQRHHIARFCLDMISLYFTALANGNSRMYRISDFYELLNEAGFEVVEEINNIGISHTLLKCRKKKPS